MSKPFYDPARARDKVELSWDPGYSLTAIAWQDAPENYNGTGVFLSSVGWFGGTGARTSAGSSPHGHGDQITPFQHTPRSITLVLGYVFPTFVEATATENRISGMMPQGEIGTLTITREGVPMSAGVRRDGEIDFDWKKRDTLVVSIPLVAPDPFKYGEAQSTTVRPEGAGRGAKWTQHGFINGKFDWGIQGDPAKELFNYGNAYAWPQIRLEGSAPDGLILEVGEGMLHLPQWLPHGKPILWDTRYSRVTRSGQDITHLANLVVSEPTPPEAACKIRLYSPGSVTTDYRAVVALSPTYL